MIEVSHNSARVSQDLGEFIHESGQEDGKAVFAAARGVTNGVLKLTPPFQTLSPLESFTTQRKIGEQAVQRDLNRSFKAIDDLKVLTDSRKPLVMKKVQKAVDKRDGPLLATVLTSLKYSNITSDRIVDSASQTLHNSLRKNGRVPRNASSFFVFNKKSLEQLQETLLEAVGRAKAGWLAAAYAVNVAVPSWITRHGAPGIVRDRTAAAVDPSFLTLNNVSYIADFGAEYRIVELALGREADSLERQLIAKRNGLWNKKRSASHE